MADCGLSASPMTSTPSDSRSMAVRRSRMGGASSTTNTLLLLRGLRTLRMPLVSRKILQVTISATLFYWSDKGRLWGRGHLGAYRTNPKALVLLLNSATCNGDRLC